MPVADCGEFCRALFVPKYPGIEPELDEVVMLVKAPVPDSGFPRKENHTPDATAAETKATEKLRKYIDDSKIIRDWSLFCRAELVRSRKTWFDDVRGKAFQLKLLRT